MNPTELISNHHQDDEQNTVLLTRLPLKQECFIGRDEVLRELDSLMKEKQPAVLINGMEGIGKTEVCRQWFLNHYREYKYAGWIDYTDSLRQSFFTGVNLPEQDTGSGNIDEQYEAIMSFLEKQPDQVLLVVDNIEDPCDEDLEDLRRLPFQVLASSCKTLHGFAARDLDELSLAHCKELFYQYYDIERGEETDGYVEQVIKLCGHHTLTVELLARTAQNAGQPVKWLYRKLKDYGVKICEKISPEAGTHWNGGRENKELMKRLGAAFDLAGFDKEEIWLLVNLSLLPAIGLGIDDIREWLDLDSGELVDSLIEKGWLKQKGSTVFMHQIIGGVVRQKRPPYLEDYMKLLIAIAWNLKYEPGDIPVELKEFAVLGESVVTRLEPYHDVFLAPLAMNLSLFYKDIGHMKNALESQLIAIELLEETLDKNHPVLATSYTNLSVIYQKLELPEQALDFQKKAIEILEAVPDKNPPDETTTCNNLSDLRAILAQKEKELGFQKNADGIFEEALKQNPPDFAQIFKDLSAIHSDLKNFPDVLAFCRRAVETMEQIFPNGNHMLDIAKKNLEGFEKMMIDE